MNHLKRKAPRHFGTLSILVVNIFWRVWEENTSTFGVRYSTFDIKKNAEYRISNVEVNPIPWYPTPLYSAQSIRGYDQSGLWIRQLSRIENAMLRWDRYWTWYWPSNIPFFRVHSAGRRKNPGNLMTEASVDHRTSCLNCNWSGTLSMYRLL